jgi:hypothetical protein
MIPLCKSSALIRSLLVSNFGFNLISITDGSWFTRIANKRQRSEPKETHYYNSFNPSGKKQPSSNIMQLPGLWSLTPRKPILNKVTGPVLAVSHSFHQTQASRLLMPILLLLCRRGPPCPYPLWGLDRLEDYSLCGCHAVSSSSYVYTSLYGVTLQKGVIFILTAVGTSDPTCHII